MKNDRHNANNGYKYIFCSQLEHELLDIYLQIHLPDTDVKWLRLTTIGIYYTLVDIMI